MPYSIDLRERVIAAVDEGKSPTVIAKTFKICTRVIYKWLKLREETNSLKPKSGYQKGHSHKIVEWDKFKLFVETNQCCSIPMMVVRWKQSTGTDISETAMGKYLKKIGFTSKKKLLTTRKQIKKNEKDS